MTQEQLEETFRKAEEVTALRYQLGDLDIMERWYAENDAEWRFCIFKVGGNGRRIDSDGVSQGGLSLSGLTPGIAATVLERIKARREEVLKRLEELA